MSETRKLKIFTGATLVIGEPIAGFVIESMDDPFNESTFVVTGAIDSVSFHMDDVLHAVGPETIMVDGEAFEIERVQRSDWMNLMVKLDAYRHSAT